MNTKPVLKRIDDLVWEMLSRKNAMSTEREAEFIADAHIILNRAEELVKFLEVELGVE